MNSMLSLCFVSDATGIYWRRQVGRQVVHALVTAPYPSPHTAPTTFGELAVTADAIAEELYRVINNTDNSLVRNFTDLYPDRFLIHIVSSSKPYFPNRLASKFRPSIHGYFTPALILSRGKCFISKVFGVIASSQKPHSTSFTLMVCPL